jgi:hypothetical protein
MRKNKSGFAFAANVIGLQPLSNRVTTTMSTTHPITQATIASVMDHHQLDPCSASDARDDCISSLDAGEAVQRTVASDGEKPCSIWSRIALWATAICWSSLRSQALRWLPRRVLPVRSTRGVMNNHGHEAFGAASQGIATCLFLYACALPAEPFQALDSVRAAEDDLHPVRRRRSLCRPPSQSVSRS